MTRRKFLLIYLFMIGGLLAVLFQIKYTVLDLEGEYKKLRALIREKQEDLHVLNAEWAYLNDPDRLLKLSKKYLNLRPIRGQQIVAYECLQNSGLGEYDREGLLAIINKSQGVLNRGGVKE